MNARPDPGVPEKKGERPPPHRPIPTVDRTTKLRITPTRFGFRVEVIQGVLAMGPWWRRTREGAQRKGLRVVAQERRKNERRARAVEVVVDEDVL